MHKTVAMTDRLLDYVVANGVRGHPVLDRIRRETAALGDVAVMQIPPDQGAFMQLLALSIGARRAIEVGTFTGYSALAVALALPADGGVTCCELDPDYASKARSYWAEAGMADRIEVRIGPAAETLERILRAPPPGLYDFAFIDADKTGYPVYYERCLALLRPGGLLLLDNMLWSGKVADPDVRDESTETIRALTRRIHEDARVDACLLTVADGLLLCRKR
jgi:predicted O-methyltransferase YrrM